jgi:hypothetical protein
MPKRDDVVLARKLPRLVQGGAERECRRGRRRHAAQLLSPLEGIRAVSS